MTLRCLHLGKRSHKGSANVEFGPDYKLDPVQDLRPVCLNFHAMLH
jgi:hypothetical protein